MRLMWTRVMTGGFGNPNNKLIRALVEFKGYLYAMTANGADGGEIHRSVTGEPGTWEEVVDRAFLAFGNTRHRPFRSLRVWNDRLYVGTGFVAQIWRSEDGTRWEKVADNGFGKGKRNLSVRSLELFRNCLYAGAGTEFIGSAGVYRSCNGDAWKPVVSDGFGRPWSNNHVYALKVFNDQLYAGTFNALQGAAVYRSHDGQSWEPVAQRGFGHRGNVYVYEFRAYQPTPSAPAKLVAITGGNPAGGEAWIYDGTIWSPFALNGFGKRRNSDIWTASQFESDFYVGTWKFPWQRSDDNGAELWRYDYATGRWEAETLDGFGNPANDGFRVLFPWRGALYATLRNPTTGAELWKATVP
ncbi:MAG: hypothetical protein HY314_14885 [Acidobacteria bacterium]|nr:hypothetical protein [Acidobacteriota bacterium]